MNLLLGNNGAGKTTTLKALALASLAPAFARSSGFLTYNLVRNGTNLAKPEAELVLHPQDSPAGAQGLVPRCGVECRDRKLGESEAQPSPVFDGPPHERMFESETPAFFVVGYGATRRVEESSSYNPADQLKRRGLW